MLLAKMHAAINQNNKNVTAGTVHRFQGDEKDIMILDTVNSLGDNQVGVWAMADQPNEDGCTGMLVLAELKTIYLLLVILLI